MTRRYNEFSYHLIKTGLLKITIDYHHFKILVFRETCLVSPQSVLAVQVDDLWTGGDNESPHPGVGEGWTCPLPVVRRPLFCFKTLSSPHPGFMVTVPTQWVGFIALVGKACSILWKY